MRPVRFCAAVFSLALLASCVNEPAEAPTCPEAVQTVRMDPSVGFILSDTAGWKIAASDSGSLVLERVACGETTPPARVTIQRHASSNDSDFAWLSTPAGRRNIHDFRKVAALDAEAYARALDSVVMTCGFDADGLCFGAPYHEAFIFFGDFLLRVVSTPGIGEEPLLGLFRGLVYAEKPLADPRARNLLKFHRDNVDSTMEAVIPDSLYGFYLSFGERQEVIVYANGLRSAGQCDDRSDFDFIERRLCRLRYRILHPLD